MIKFNFILIFSLLTFLTKADAATEFNFTGKFYSLSVNETTGSVNVKSTTGESIFSRLKYYTEYTEENKTDTLRMKDAHFKLTVLKQTNASAQIVLKYSTDAVEVLLTLNLLTENSEINFSVQTKYRKNVKVIRESLLIDFDIPVTEVYRKNRQLHDKDFQDEYWLDKEGVKFGEGKRNAFIYHVPKISSLQLNTPSNELIANLDYCKDHPFMHFPFIEGKKNVKEDLSCSVYKTGETKENSFSIFAGNEVKALPRLMLNPNGFLSAYIFTEHADWTDIRTHRAVYFGSEEITDAGKATGGFVKNKIPVTKSVFYANPDHVLNSQSTHKIPFTTPIANIKETEGFPEFLQQLNKRGYDICLHTPDQFTSQRPLLEEAISFMKKNFNTVSWIDHGYDNGAKNNREDLICDGLLKSSSSYTKDFWDKYGTKFFWNAYHEDFTTDDSIYTFYSSQIIPYIGFGDCFPTPNYSRHPTMTGNFYSWYTRDILDMTDVTLWNYHFGKERLNDFVNNGAIKFNHCYPAGGSPDRGFWKFDNKNKIIIEPEFENALERLAAYRDSGLINLSTVRDMLNYWTDCEKIKFDYLPDGKIKITNQNDHDIKGLSLAIKANSVLVDGKTPSEKKWKDDLIFWFDIKARKSTTLQLSN